MKRADLVKVALQGDLGKPRPALIVQTNLLALTQSVIILPLTSQIADAPLARITVEPSASNGLRQRSQVMIDKITNIRREKVGGTIGELESDIMMMVDESLALFLGLA
jgi:Growth inhibitor